jgi:hypothetical protein
MSATAVEWTLTSQTPESSIAVSVQYMSITSTKVVMEGNKTAVQVDLDEARYVACLGFMYK